MSWNAKAMVNRYLEKAPDSAGPRLVQGGIMGVILLNVAAVIFGTLHLEGGERVEDRCSLEFRILEIVSVAIFTVEYGLRIWSITVDPRFARSVRGRIRYALTPMAIIDLLAVLPFYVELALALGFGSSLGNTEVALVLRALRLFRVFRLFKLGHYSRAVQALTHALKSKRGELAVTVFAVGILLVIASTVMYLAECDAQPDRFSSIPASMWWGIITLTTVGYGDITPVTTLGKIAGAVVAIFGIGLVALPAGILGSAFVQEIGDRQRPPPARARCPHCGKELT
jgi:voltage-gated potassium channel